MLDPKLIGSRDELATTAFATIPPSSFPSIDSTFLAFGATLDVYFVSCLLVAGACHVGGAERSLAEGVSEETEVAGEMGG